jgi:two-component system response regulator NreC
MTRNESEQGSATQRHIESIAGHKLVVIAASAGSLEPLVEVLALLPADFPAAIAVVKHRGEQVPELLPELLARRTALKVRHAEGGEPLEPGTVYICPPGMHMGVERCVLLMAGPKLDHVRPSADLMFQSVASAYGDQAIGVVLSGLGSDGAAGSVALAEAGGTVIALDPMASSYPSMPNAAIARGKVDRVLPPARIAEVLRRLVDREDSGGPNDPPAVAAPARATRILLVDDQQIMLEGLHSLLEGERDLEVVGEATDGHAAVRLAYQLAPHVVVMAIAMPSLNGLDATRRIRTLSPATRVVILSARADARTAARAYDAGAGGYLSKADAFVHLLLAIRAVDAGKRYVGPGVAALAAVQPSGEGSTSAFELLTLREREVLQLLAEGHASRRIAILLGLCTRTVQAHGRRLMEKLGIHDVAGLTRYAIREGLATADL